MFNILNIKFKLNKVNILILYIINIINYINIIVSKKIKYCIKLFILYIILITLFKNKDYVKPFILII